MDNQLGQPKNNRTCNQIDHRAMDHRVSKQSPRPVFAHALVAILGIAEELPLQREVAKRMPRKEKN